MVVVFNQHLKIPLIIVLNPNCQALKMIYFPVLYKVLIIHELE